LHMRVAPAMLLLACCAVAARALVLAPLPPIPATLASCGARTTAIHLEVDQEQQVESPFSSDDSSSSSGPGSGPLELTLENVEMVLDEMRPYLIADGGNVAVVDIEGGVVQLELQGACGSCASSTMTMKMGLERGLLEKIPEIVAVEQVAPSGPQLTEEAIEEVLDEIRPFLKMAGGSVDLVDLDPAGVQPTARLAITGSGSTINSVRVEIAQRLKRNFPTLANVDFA